MTRMHFIAMAKEIKAIADIHVRETMATAFVRVAISVNSRFDEQRFRNACDLPNG